MSYYDDFLDCGYDSDGKSSDAFDAFMDRLERACSKGVWIDRKGCEHIIKNMSLDHLYNVAHFINRNKNYQMFNTLINTEINRRWDEEEAVCGTNSK